MLASKIRKKENLIESTLLENYDKYFRLALSYVHSEDDAADIVQNGAYRAIKNASKLETDSYAGTWIYKIMLNEVFRFMKNSREVISMDELSDEGVDIGKEDEYEDLDLQEAIDHLEKNDKAIVELRFFEDKSLEEIADILNMNISTVKSRLYRSLKKLRLIMEADEE